MEKSKEKEVDSRIIVVYLGTLTGQNFNRKLDIVQFCT